jgi:hypothetical protein
MKGLAFLLGVVVLTLWLLQPPCQAAESVDAAEGDDGQPLERNQAVGDFYATDPTFHPRAKIERKKVLAIRNDWNSWSHFVTFSLVRLLYHDSMKRFQGKDLGCRFSFSMTSDNKVRDARIVEPSNDPVFDQAVLQQVRALDTSRTTFPKATKERVVRVTATYSTKPSLTSVDVTTLKGVLLNKKESSKQ